MQWQGAAAALALPVGPNGPRPEADTHDRQVTVANIKSQIKRNRQNEKRRLRNRSVRSELNSRTKSALDAAEHDDAETADEMLRLASKRLDKAAAKGVIHKRTAARRKSRLAREAARRQSESADS